MAQALSAAARAHKLSSNTGGWTTGAMYHPLNLTPLAFAKSYTTMAHS